MHLHQSQIHWWYWKTPLVSCGGKLSTPSTKTVNTTSSSCSLGWQAHLCRRHDGLGSRIGHRQEQSYSSQCEGTYLMISELQGHHNLILVCSGLASTNIWVFVFTAGHYRWRRQRTRAAVINEGQAGTGNEPKLNRNSHIVTLLNRDILRV